MTPNYTPISNVANEAHRRPAMGTLSRTLDGDGRAKPVLFGFTRVAVFRHRLRPDGPGPAAR
jgi:hypothetical protein